MIRIQFFFSPSHFLNLSLCRSPIRIATVVYHVWGKCLFNLRKNFLPLPPGGTLKEVIGYHKMVFLPKGEGENQFFRARQSLRFGTGEETP